MPCVADHDCKSKANPSHNPRLPRWFQTDDGPAIRSARCGYSAQCRHFVAVGLAQKIDVDTAFVRPILGHCLPKTPCDELRLVAKTGSFTAPNVPATAPPASTADSPPPNSTASNRMRGWWTCCKNCRPSRIAAWKNCCHCGGGLLAMQQDYPH